jgi:hypothetical protein
VSDFEQHSAGREARRATSGRFWTPGGRQPVPAPARGFDDEDVTGRQVGAVTRGQGLHAAISPLDPVAADSARETSGHTVGRHPAVAGQDADGDRFPEAEPPYGTVTAVPAARAAAASSDGELLHEHRMAPLQDLRVGQPGVGHVGLHHGHPVESVARAGAGGDRLVVLVAFVAEGDVVHRARALGLDAHGGVQGPGDRLGGLHVPGDDGRRRDGGEHRALGDDDLQRAQAAVVEGDVVGHEGPEDVEHGRCHHGGGRVEVGGQLGGGAGEVQRRAAP